MAAKRKRSAQGIGAQHAAKNARASTAEPAQGPFLGADLLELADADRATREKLVSIGRVAASFAMSSLKSPSSTERQSAERVLAIIGSLITTRLPNLLYPLLSEEDSAASDLEAALTTLTNCAVPSLFAAMEHRNAQVRASAARSVHANRFTDELVDQLVGLLQDSDVDTRGAALDALVRLCRPPRLTAHRIFSACAKVSDVDRRRIVHELTNVHTHSMGDVTAALFHENAAVRECAVSFFVYSFWGDYHKINALLKVTESEPVEKIRQISLFALARIGANAMRTAKHAVNSLCDMEVFSSNPEMQAEVVLAYEKIQSHLDELRGKNRRPVGFRVSPTKRIRSKRAKRTAELEKSLLAMIDTCLEWGPGKISQRKLETSELLRTKRKKLGLREKASRSLIHYHLGVLARQCGVPSILVISNDRQSSQWEEGIVERLLRVRPIVVRMMHDAAAAAEDSR